MNMHRLLPCATPVRRRVAFETDMAMNVVVSHPLSDEVGGSVSCFPAGREPFAYEWTDATTKERASLSFGTNEGEVVDVPPGDYSVRATDASGRAAYAEVRVRAGGELPVVVEYRVQDASTDTARDGEVEAVVEGLRATEGVLYRWSNGIVTRGPALRDVRPGSYTVVLVREKGGRLPFCHVAEPGVVGVKSSRDERARPSKASRR